ncbi:MAG: tetratricopeptide repeat protein, partial [bacterium]|nr:tetratricopeptide repeat protein [bacterium]
MRKEYPFNRAILYDYIVVLSRAGKDIEALKSSRQWDLLTVPLYVLKAIADSKRRTADFGGAMLLYGNILKKQADYLPAKIGIAFCLAEKGDPDAGLNLLVKEKENAPGNIEILQALAHIYGLKKDAQSEQLYYRKILEIDPDNTLASKKTVDLQLSALVRAGDYVKALEYLENLLAKEPGNRKAFYDTIAVLAWSGKAGVVMEKSADIDMNDAPLYVLEAIAQSYRDKQKPGAAQRIYNKILERYPEHLPAKIGVPLCLAEIGYPAKSLLLLKELEKNHHHNTGLLFAMAYVYRLDKKFFDEMRYYQKILAIEPESKAAKRAYIVSVSTLGAPNVALEMLELLKKEEEHRRHGKKEKESTEGDKDTIQKQELGMKAISMEQIWGDRAAQWIR